MNLKKLSDKHKEALRKGLKLKWQNQEFRKNMSEKYKGERNPAKRLDVRKKISESKSGISRNDLREKYKGCANPNYRNGLSTSKRIILEVKKLCEYCGTNKNLEIHHKDKNRDNNQLSNLILLCRSCHSKQHRGKEWHNYVYSIRKKIKEENINEEIIDCKKDL
jgi:hypothetical protein